MKYSYTKKLILAAMFLAIGMVLPFFTAQIKEIGDSLLPMHLPVMLCGLICGPAYGLVVGFVMPLLRGVIFGMPPVYPSGVWMAFELATYGFIIGFLYFRSSDKSVRRVYFSLISAIIAGRIVWGIVKSVLLGIGGRSFTFYAFIVGGFVDAFPGIVLQLLLVPFIMSVVIKYQNNNSGGI